MSFSVSTQPLSAISPVKFNYKFNKQETLSKSLFSFNNGFEYYSHKAFENCQDAVLSKKNCLFLTDSKPLKDVFESDSRQVDLGILSGCLFLKSNTGKYLTTLHNSICVGGVGEKLFVTIIPILGSLIELRVDKTKYLQIDKEYPYTARLSEEPLDGEELARQQFELEHKDGLVSFKTKTKEGFRYLSWGADQVVRAVGLTMNSIEVNPYLLIAEVISEDGLYYDFDARSSEVKYHNDLVKFDDRATVKIKEEQESDTSLLISCTTTDIAKSNEVAINIALTKTNFSASGSYSTKRSV